MVIEHEKKVLWSLEVKIGLNGNEVGIDYLLIRKVAITVILFLGTVGSLFQWCFHISWFCNFNNMVIILLKSELSLNT